MEISNLYSTSTILVEYERTTKKVPTMKPLDSDKKVSKEVSAPAEAAQTAPVVEEKSIFPMFRSSRCSRTMWTSTPSPSLISAP